MLRKRTRSIQKDQHQMGHQPISDSGSESFFPHSSDVLNDNPKSYKNNSFYSVPGLLVGLSPKGLTSTTDCDSVRSPTSPLDFKLFSSLGNPFKSSSTTTTTTTTTTRATQENGQQRIWGVSSKVGLISIIDSLDDDMKFPGKVLRSSESKNILFGPSFRIKTCSGGQANTNSFESPKSLPKNYASFPPALKTKSPFGKGSSDVLFEIGESPLEPASFGEIRSCSLDSCREISNVSGNLNNSNYNPNSTSTNFCLESKVVTQVSSPPQFIEGSPNSNQISGSKLSAIPGSVGSGNGFIGSLSASEIELSEDYTCVISHGPNPKTTHIFGDCILETESCDLNNSFGKNGDNKEVGLSPPIVENPEISAPFSSDYFLSFCYSCNKKLEDGKDIYIYRGEKAFCSLSCRSLEILIDEELEKSNDKDPESPLYSNDDDNDDKELFEAGLKAAT